MIRYAAVVLLLHINLSQVVSANVQVNGIFSDNMVLQRGMPDPIWGAADPGESVTVAFAGQKKSVVANPQGQWRVRLDPMKENATPDTLTISGDKTPTPLVIKNVLVGDVWFCSGQSNMEWGVYRSTDMDQIVAASENPLLRMGRVPHNGVITPQASVPVTWNQASTKTTKLYSALPYFIGAGLQKELGIPIGIINNSYGGTRIEAWLSSDVLKNGPWPQDHNTIPELAKAEYDKKVLAAQPVVAQYEAAKAAALQNHQPPPPAPPGLPEPYRGSGSLWNGETAPVAGFAIKGFVWYQGENNGNRGEGPRYFELLKALAKSYRLAWGEDFPIIVCQLCTYYKPNGYADIREAELHYVQQDQNSALIVTLDQSDPQGDVHYHDKRVVGTRVVRAALGLAYGVAGEFSGPIYDSVQFDGGSAKVKFQHLGGGLVAHDGALRHFQIAGADRVFFDADAVIDGDTVRVSSPKVPQPVAVRYGFTNFPWPPVNLFNQAGLPASPFRTDDWPSTSDHQTQPPAPPAPAP